MSLCAGAIDGRKCINSGWRNQMWSDEALRENMIVRVPHEQEPSMKYCIGRQDLQDWFVMRMQRSNPVTGTEFTPEQVQFLEGFFQGAMGTPRVTEVIDLTWLPDPDLTKPDLSQETDLVVWEPNARDLRRQWKRQEMARLVATGRYVWTLDGNVRKLTLEEIDSKENQEFLWNVQNGSVALAQRAWTSFRNLFQSE